VILAQTLDQLDEWPETDPISRNGDMVRGLMALRAHTNGFIGPAVVDILRWHDIVVDLNGGKDPNTYARLDLYALDLWAVAATLIAEGWENA
jgi:hypothetical protein